jgi:hypothetical protein
LDPTDDVSNFKELYGNLASIKVTLERAIARAYTPGPRISNVDDGRRDAIPEKGLKGRPLDVGMRSGISILE